MSWDAIVNAQLARDPLPIIDPRDWQDKPVPPRKWIVQDLIPDGVVTNLSGDGGTGKTLTAIQLMTAMSLGLSWFGKPVQQGPALLYTAEDDAEELHRRFAAVTASSGHRLADLAGVQIIPMAGLDATLATGNDLGGISMSSQFAKLSKIVADTRPRLVAIDPAADVYAGDEIKRVQVRQFVQKLAKLALDNECAVLLLSHPSLSGMMTGRGTSGSTAWSNSVRSRLYLQADADDPDRRLLKVMKANYGAVGEEIALRWNNGAFVLDQGGDGAGASMAQRAADDVFLATFIKLTAQGHRLSPKPCATYAPKMVAEHRDAKGYTKPKMKDAMQRLLDAGVLRIETHGPPSRRYDVLASVSN
ncbi:RecA-family ATPase [Bradyrhizobium sp. USDA 372]